VCKSNEFLDDFKIGHVTDSENGTGVTVIIAENGATGGASILGASPATRETDLLRNGKTVQELNAVVLSGGSAFGLEAASGVTEWLFKRGFGYRAGKYRVPIVAGASLFDLEYKNFSYPKKDDGYRAASVAHSGNFARGDIGAGTGATVGKILGNARAMKGGLGTSLLNDDGGLQAAFIVAVNAVGDILDTDGAIIAGARIFGKFVNSKLIYDKIVPKTLKNTNTTIGCLITNAKLTRAEANEIAEAAHAGYAAVTSPDHTPFDGDAVFVMASGHVKGAADRLKAWSPKLAAQAILSVFKKD
jgi:L-aminopeptidase/D-esterase-like protein